MASSSRGYVEHVGIRGIYVYFPHMMVQQQDLEAADGCPGKYTVGLGQQAMTFCGDREDVVSMAATAVLTLLENNGVKPTDIGRIEVGTETGVDRSKSVMSYLTAYFNTAGNYTLQGADHMHGCYGGTSALFTVTDWVASPSWDGRLGLVVATDIAVYPPGSPARPTGGCGAAAMLIGPDAPLVVEPWPWRASFSAHTYDFFKPHGHPLYPVVDGPATLLWFSKAADACAAQLYLQLQQRGLLGALCRHKQQQQQDQQPGQQQQQQQQQGLLAAYDFFLSHSPYNKIVRKVFARLVLHDGLRCAQLANQQQQQQPPPMQRPQAQPSSHHPTSNGNSSTSSSSSSSSSSSRPALPPLPPEAADLLSAALESAAAAAAAAAAGEGSSSSQVLPMLVLPDSSITDKSLERALLASSSQLCAAMASPAAALQCQLGNLYTASLYSGLTSLLDQQGAGLAGKRLLCFSFGSGVVASMFTLTGRDTTTGSSSSGGGSSGGASSGSEGVEAGGGQQQQQQRQSGGGGWRQAPCSLQQMADQLRLPQRLAARQPCSVSDFDAAMASLRAAYNSAPYTPSYGSLEDLAPGTVYLSGIDEGFKRTYGRRPL